MKFIDTPALLDACVRQISAAAWAAVDTEADSLHHYAEKLSLLQVSVPGEDYVIDPLAGLDLSPLLSALSAKPLILHASDSDIRLLKKAHEFKPREVFDTLIAAQLLGYERMGYADLVEKHCAVKLSKSEQKADWSRRPLSDKMLVYASNDTHYLSTLRDVMKKELEALGRLDWHRQQCDKLLQVLELLKPQEADPARDWQIKGSKELKGKALTLLKELWLWREAQAKEKDRPPFKVLNSEYLVEIAQWGAAHPGEDVGQWEKAPRNVKGEHRAVINRILQKTDHLPQAEYQHPLKPKVKKRWTDREAKALVAMKAAREKKAAELKIHPSLLATNAMLEAVAIAKPKDLEAFAKLDMLLPWQLDAAGAEFLQALNGGIIEPHGQH